MDLFLMKRAARSEIRIGEGRIGKSITERELNLTLKVLVGTTRRGNKIIILRMN